MTKPAKRNGLFCPVCDNPQFETRSGAVCKEGHGGEEGYSKSDSLAYVYNWIQKIKETKGTNDKVDLLRKYMEDDGFLKCIQYMYDDHLHYGVNELSLVQCREFDKKKLFGFLDILAKQKGTSNTDKGKLAELCSVDFETKKLVHMIINKDAKAGFGAKTINKARSDTVYEEPYMRCSTEKKIDRIVYPAIAQQKADGIFVNIKISKNGKIRFISRNGKRIFQMYRLRKLLKRKFPKKYRGVVLHGELLIRKNGKILDRQTGNGILTSCLYNTADQKDADQAIIKIWDIVPMKTYKAHYFDVSYFNRFKRCRKLVKLVNHKDFACIRTKIIYSFKEAEEFYKMIRKLGGEGAIIKNFLLKWKYHTSTESIKMKNISEGEFRIASIKKGKKGTKWEDCVGSIQCESECGKVQFSVGGLSDKEHLRDWDDWLTELGSVCSVEYDGLIKDKTRKGIWSLYLPRNLVLRPDRTYADTLEMLQKR